MNASERLQAIIKQRLEGEAFGWGLPLMVWAGVTAARTLVEVFTGPSLALGGLGYAALVVFQLLWSHKVRTPASRDWSLQGLWFLIAPMAWFLGSAAPVLDWISPRGGAVLELVFLGGGLAQTGLLKSRPVLLAAGAALIVASVAVGILPFLLAWRPLILVVAFGLPAWFTHRWKR